MYIQEHNGIKENKDNNYNLNMKILSSIKDLSIKSISLHSSQIIDKSNPHKINLINISDIERETTQNNAYITSTTNNSSSILNKTLPNLPLQNNLNKNSIFNSIGWHGPPSNFFHPFNYLPNFIPPYPFYLNSPNYCPSIYYNYNYDINNHNFLDWNKLAPPNNKDFKSLNINNEENTPSNKEGISKNDFLNKKRKLDDNVELNQSKTEQNYLFNNEEDEIYKNGKQYKCEHLGCDLQFRTKKLAIFHHFKMSPECQEDCISFLKLIYETKKIILKNIEKNKKSFDKYSSLYENTMKNLSLNEYIKILTGFKINDNL